ncbi:MAG: type II toxin-antitoxin system HicA family toxin [Verrucomicrobia bacterium]|nr:type II toxin-antitoxin system HicA family toxin [Verrucomicrobiota bacterium]MCZ7638931.1 type II toxin-antitoxin system HicA family toxin [Verrucomicrobiota bacterium]
MKRRDLLRHLAAYRCRLDREGSAHSLWKNPETGVLEAIPRHAEIGKHLARKICRRLSVPEPRGA